MAGMKFKTPSVVAVWPSLHKTETYQGADTNKYKCKVKLTAEQAAPLVALAKEAAVDEYGPKKAGTASLPFKKMDDGSIVLTTSSYNKPTMFDTKGNPIPFGIKVGNGSVVRVAGNFKPIKGKVGVSAYFNAIQIVKLEEIGGGNPFANDDAADEEGFVYSPNSSSPFAEDVNETKGADEEDDDIPF